MANTSIYKAFERMWQHIISKLGDKVDKASITYGTEVPTEAPSTGDGSIYFFEDELIPVAVTEGGTGATDATTALANLGIVDYIVEQIKKEASETGHYFYRRSAVVK